MELPKQPKKAYTLFMEKNGFKQNVWNDLPPNERKYYERLAQEDKDRWNKEMVEYRRTKIFSKACARKYPEYYLADFVRACEKKDEKRAMEIYGKGGRIGPIGFYVACEYGCLDVATYISDTWISKEFKEAFDSTLIDIGLGHAGRYGHLNVIKWMYETFSKIYPGIRERLVDTFYSACTNCYMDIVEWILENARPSSFIIFNCLDRACVTGDIELVKILIDKTDKAYAYVAFTKACFHGNVRIAEVFLERGFIGKDMYQKLRKEYCGILYDELKDIQALERVDLNLLKVIAEYSF